jgi:hypothetical protein
MLNLSLIVLQHVLPLGDYKVWIDTERGSEEKHYLHNMVELNMMEERKCAAYFAIQREMDREEYKVKREEERARKHEKARRVKEAYARGGEKPLMKGRLPHLMQD